jgi:hypothetical protein
MDDNMDDEDEFGSELDDEEEEQTMPSSAPLSIRGPFSVLDSLREHVSKDRLRYKMDGFNLDMRYITPNIIALAAPSDRGVSSMMRNPVDEVVRFFRLKHEGKALFFNLIGEANAWEFDAHRLGVVNHQFAFLDQSVPTIALMQAFCIAVKQWLDKDPGNVAVIMCKSGRNRTAIMACAYLLFRWPAEFGTATEVMEYFSHRRMREGPALREASQRRWVSYFSQRFAAVPQVVKLSKLVVPHGPLKVQKLRIDVHRLVQGSLSGNAMEEELVWTSKGKGMGSVEESDSYVIFSFPEPLTLTGDIKLTLSGRKYANGAFNHVFHMWFNTGFVDHSPMVWDKQCFDGLNAAHKKELPDDFHIQTLFIGQPRIACTVSKVKPARIYCWDCDDPFLSEEESITVHQPKIALGADGEEEEMKTGPRHRYHPLIEEECALCEKRRIRLEKGDPELEKLLRDDDDGPMLSNAPKTTIEYRNRHVRKETLAGLAGDDKFTLESKAYSVAEGLKLVTAKKSMIEREKKKELLMHQNAGNITGAKRIKPPLYNFPTIFCEDTKQYLCSWCSRNALGPNSKSYTKISIPVIASSTMRYSGCARQVC